MRGTFWLSLVVLGYTFCGYFLLVWLGARIAGRRVQKRRPDNWPPVTVVVIAHNEALRIAGRLQNLLESDYPADKLEIILVSDGSDDQTVPIAAQMNDPRIHLLSVTPRAGKAAGINHAMAAANGGIIVFTDVRQRFAANTIQELVANFSDPQVGAVGGALEIDPAATAGGTGVDLYWRLEKQIRSAEARLDSSIGCTGAVYAIRKELYRPLPTDTILDDVVNPMQIAVQGYRVSFDETAVAYDPQTLEPEREKLRKRRTLAGNFQMLFRHPHWLLPWRNRLWWQLISHKYLRLAAPGFLACLLAANLALVGISFYRELFFGQCLFYGLAVSGMFFSTLKWRIISIPAGFCFLNLMVVAGFWHYLRMGRNGAWSMVKS